MQAKYILGYNIARGNQLHILLHNLAKGIHSFQWLEFVLGCVWLLVLFLIRGAPKLGRQDSVSLCYCRLSIREHY